MLHSNLKRPTIVMINELKKFKWDKNETITKQFLIGLSDNNQITNLTLTLIILV